MLKGSALYMVIIVALIIGIICSALVLVAYNYQMEFGRSFRRHNLENNLASGRAIILKDSITIDAPGKSIDIFDDQRDSLLLSRYPWGIFDVGTVTAFKLQDTLRYAFEIGASIDSVKWFALYVSDQDRPLSVSGKTTIIGNAYLPKSGIRAAYVDNQAYQGTKDIVTGHRFISKSELPSPEQKYLQALIKLNEFAKHGDSVIKEKFTLNGSFFDRPLIVNLRKQPLTLSSQILSGHLFIRSDTTITIDSSAHLRDVIIMAKTIKVGNGFRGTCQLFATDTLIAGSNSEFSYPSALAILPFDQKDKRVYLSLNERTIVNGSVVLWRTGRKTENTLLEIGKEAIVNGQVYTSGTCVIKAGLTINGSIAATKFLYKNDFTLYENYLIGAHIDNSKLPTYYLTGMLLPAPSHNYNVIRWLQ